MGKRKNADEERTAQEAAAQALQQQIDDIVSGKVPSGPPRNLRDFIDQKTRRDQKRTVRRSSSPRKPKKH
jgi:hypothetical protein